MEHLRPYRIDTHAHVVPPFYAQTLAETGTNSTGWFIPEWSPEIHLEFMNRNYIARSMLSLTSPGIMCQEGSKRSDMARRVNDFTAEITKTYPERFGHFTTLPLPYRAESIAEIDYCYEQLHVDGVILMTNYDGIYLGDPLYTPIWEALNHRKAVVFIHPTNFFAPNSSGLPAPLVEFPSDTTINAVHMVYNGVLDNFPHLSIILSHAGGFLPYAALRFSALSAMDKPVINSERDFEPMLSRFKMFYFDTALSSGKYAISTLQQFADPGRILYGSDFPYAADNISSGFTRLLDDHSGLTEEQKMAIDYGNAEKLWNHTI